jgi:AcrR family transcriptional regulator
LLIANEAGVSRGPLHYHFRDKNDLMAAIAAALPLRAPPELRARLDRLTDPQERFTAVIDIALEGHTGHHHFAAMELLMAARNDPELAAAIGPHFDASEEATDAWWVEYMNGLDLPCEDLLALRHVAVACLRGLALDHILHQDREAHARAAEMFRSIFTAHVTLARAQA